MLVDAERLFAEITPGRGCYVGRAAKRLGVSEDEARRLGEELVDAGRCEWENARRRTIRRATNDAREETRLAVTSLQA
jgi:hypothetical protein